MRTNDTGVPPGTVPSSAPEGQDCGPRFTDGSSSIEGPGHREEDPDQLPPQQNHILPPGLKLLVVEDNTILALDVEDMLLRNGAGRIVVAGNCEEALQFLDSESFSAALVDLRLPGDDSLRIANRLSELQTPFLFAKGYGENAVAPTPFQAVQVVGKPYCEFFLLARLIALLAERSDSGGTKGG
jgi:CheY-like chemotaxis protein